MSPCEHKYCSFLLRFSLLCCLGLLTFRDVFIQFAVGAARIPFLLLTFSLNFIFFKLRGRGRL